MKSSMGKMDHNNQDPADDNQPTIYEQAKQQGQSIMRQALLDTASRLLASEGPHALSMRRIAKETGCSTMVLYSTFGSKEALIDGLFLEGFQRLNAALDRVDNPGDPRCYALQLCRAYRETAHANPTHYAIMFQNAIPEYEPSESSRLEGKQSIVPLHSAIQQAIEEEHIVDEDAEALTMRLWAAAHGVVSLELSAYLSAEIGERMYDQMMKVLLCMNDQA